jgi:hypothetical protein
MDMSDWFFSFYVKQKKNVRTKVEVYTR